MCLGHDTSVRQHYDSELSGLPVATRYRRDMTERLLKTALNLSNAYTYHMRTNEQQNNIKNKILSKMWIFVNILFLTNL